VTRSILVYYPDPVEARAYADLIRLPSRAFRVHVASTPEEAAGPGASAEILYCWGPPRPLLAGARGLRWIQCMGAGVERLLVPELPAGVRVTRAAGIFGPWMAEYTLGWCLWVTQHMDGFRASQRQRRWAPVDPVPLRGQTLCVVGLGDIGRTIAKSARALGMQVIGVTRSGGAARDVVRVYRTKALRAALARADFVVLPAARETAGFWSGRAGRDEAPAWLLNLARGPIMDRPRCWTLRGRRIGGAVLDIFNTTPPADHRWRFDNVVVTPHISGPSTPREIGPIFNDNLRRYATNRPLRHLVNRLQGY
jgi:glyoxylate/hydroxypyruvate reductase A